MLASCNNFTKTENPDLHKMILSSVVLFYQELIKLWALGFSQRGEAPVCRFGLCLLAWAPSPSLFTVIISWAVKWASVSTHRLQISSDLPTGNRILTHKFYITSWISQIVCWSPSWKLWAWTSSQCPPPPSWHCIFLERSSVQVSWNWWMTLQCRYIKSLSTSPYPHLNIWQTTQRH